ncbi:MAG: hypothetical protein AB7O32_07930 [Vicinamibacterales bacterium]
MSDVNTFIDTLGQDVSATVVPRVERLVDEISQKALTDYGPRVSAFASQLAKDVIAEQSVVIRDFAAGLIQELAQRYRPDLTGELHTRIVAGGIEVVGHGVRLELKNRATGAPVASLDVPVNLTIKVDAIGVTLQNTTIDLDVLR